MPQEVIVGEGTRAATCLNDDGAIRLASSFHDCLDLLHVVDVQGGNAVPVLSRVIEQLTHCYKGHESSLTWKGAANLERARALGNRFSWAEPPNSDCLTMLEARERTLRARVK